MTKYKCKCGCDHEVEKDDSEGTPECCGMPMEKVKEDESEEKEE